MKKKIFILGFSASGKTQLSRLVDGHSKISVVERHDKILNPFLEIYKNKKSYYDFLKDLSLTESGINLQKEIREKIQIKFKSKNIKFNLNIYAIRKLLKKTGYDLTEYWSYVKKGEGATASEELNDNYDFNFDFDLYEKLWKKSLFSNKTEISPEEFNDAFLESFVKAKGENVKENIYFLSPNIFEAIDFVIKENFNIKVIFLKRSIKGNVKSKILRLNQQKKFFNNFESNEKKSENEYKTHAKRILYSSYVERISQAHKNMEKLSKQDPDKFLIIETESLILDPKNTISEIFDWLKIEKEEIIFKPTMNGKILSDKDFGKIADDKEFLPQYLSNFLDFRVNKNKINFLNLKDKIKTIVIIIKYYFFKYKYFFTK